MNRKYIDFVPTKKKNATPKRGQEAPRVAHVEMPKPRVVHNSNVGSVRAMPKRTTSVTRGSETSRVVQRANVAKKASVAPRVSTSKNQVLALGVVEDLKTKSEVPAMIPKKPLDHGPVASATEAKAKNIKAKKSLKIASKSVEKPANKVNSTYTTPKTPFINQSKVEKRPLSKNVYQKKIAVPKEEPKGPVTIITKPEKDSRVGIIVTIIMTIILGATAGTVAFLLLPK